MEPTPDQMLEQLSSAEQRADRRARVQAERVWTLCGLPLLLGGVAMDQLSPTGLALLVQGLILIMFLGIAYAWTVRSGIRLTDDVRPLFPFWLPGMIVLAGGLARVLSAELAPAWTNTISGGVTSLGFVALGRFIGRAARRP